MMKRPLHFDGLHFTWDPRNDEIRLFENIVECSPFVHFDPFRGTCEHRQPHHISFCVKAQRDQDIAASLELVKNLQTNASSKGALPV